MFRPGRKSFTLTGKFSSTCVGILDLAYRSPYFHESTRWTGCCCCNLPHARQQLSRYVKLFVRDTKNKLFIFPLLDVSLTTAEAAKRHTASLLPSPPYVLSFACVGHSGSEIVGFVSTCISELSVLDEYCQFVVD